VQAFLHRYALPCLAFLDGIVSHFIHNSRISRVSVLMFCLSVNSACTAALPLHCETTGN
jgi:hypothetical protein